MKKYTKFLLPIILVVLFILLFFCLKDIYNSLKSNETVKTLDSIENYNYTLNEQDSDYFENLFKELKNTLENEELDEEKYASLVSQLFITDFYSLEYALSKSDIGGLQFVYDEYRDTFSLKAKETVYAYVESNIYGKREQELPNVTNVEIANIEQKEYSGKKEKDEEAYYVDLEITYEKDLDYPTSCSLILIHHDNKLEIVDMK